MNYKKIKSDIEKFINFRKWHNFHTQKNLSMAITKEAAELMELF